MTKKQKKYVMAGILGLGLYSTYRMSQVGLNGLGFLTLPYSYEPSAPSYSYTPTTPSYNEYSYPVKFASDNRSPFEEGYSQIPSLSSKMEDSAFLNMVRQISETDGVEVIENANSLSSTPRISNSASLSMIRVVKSQVGNAMSSSRLTAAQLNYLDTINTALAQRIVALAPTDNTSAMSGIF